MKSTCTLILAASGSLAMATQALAQEVTITYSIKWELQDPVFPGVPNKGEVWATISPEFGTIIPWTTPPGKGQPGKLVAFASSIFDTINVSNGLMGTLAWTIPTVFSSPLPGQPDGNGGIKGTNVGQVGVPINPNPVLDNPIKLLNLTWTGVVPGNGEVIEFAVSAKSAKVFLDIGTTSPIWVVHNAKIVNGGGSFYYGTPVPGTLATVGLALLVMSPRRRENSTTKETLA